MSLARADKRPDWRVGTSSGRRAPAYGDLVSVTVSIDLPFFGKRRQDPLIAARESEANRARLMRDAGERDVLAALDGDLADHAMHHQRLLNARNTLALVRKQGRVTASVSDNGPRIPATERDRVLQRFVRLDPSRASSGAGLGLALVAAIAALHDAELRLAGNHPGLLVRLVWPKNLTS